MAMEFPSASLTKFRSENLKITKKLRSAPYFIKVMYLSFNFSFQNFARKADGSGSLQEFRLLTKPSLITLQDLIGLRLFTEN